MTPTRFSFDTEWITAWLAQQTSEPTGWHNHQAIASVRDGEIIGAVLYDRYTGCDIMMHYALKSGALAAKPDFIRAVFRYPFVQLECRRVTAMVDWKNHKSRKVVRHLGFKEEGVLRDARPDDDVVVYGMLVEECKHL